MKRSEPSSIPDSNLNAALINIYLTFLGQIKPLIDFFLQSETTSERSGLLNIHLREFFMAIIAFLPIDHCFE